jgi:hypothetical protein
MQCLLPTQAHAAHSHLHHIEQAALAPRTARRRRNARNRGSTRTRHAAAASCGGCWGRVEGAATGTSRRSMETHSPRGTCSAHATSKQDLCKRTVFKQCACMQAHKAIESRYTRETVSERYDTTHSNPIPCRTRSRSPLIEANIPLVQLRSPPTCSAWFVAQLSRQSGQLLVKVSKLHTQDSEL